VSTEFDRAFDALMARGPGRMLPDLSRITALSELLGDPQLAYPTVHVTGTNGKGSVVRMVGALCSAAGLSAGTYTSPHLQSVRERLTLAGRYISPTRFAEVYDEVAVLADLLDERIRADGGERADHVTFFELLTAMAFAWFADVPVDVGVFEVGMGGRWDATNLVRGDVAVLNEIDVDHSELGDTAEAVAHEKVGIIKQGAQVVSARQAPEVERIVDAAVADAGATLWRFGEDVELVDQRLAMGGQLVALRVGDRVIDEILLPLYGEHQARNAALALGAFAALTGGSFDQMDDEVVRHGLGAVAVPGRLEVVRRDPTVVLDGAHNPHGAAAAATAVASSFGFNELILVVACLADKDIAGILAELRGAASHVIVTEAPSPRAAPLQRMHEAAVATWEGTGIAVEVVEDLGQALQVAESMAAEGDGVLVAGSLHTVGAARDRYLPFDDLDELGSDDEVVWEPEDEEDGDPIPEDIDLAIALELAAQDEDQSTFDEAVERLLEEEGDDT
jgi:dihydrofolate synthase / folylpolyglutamate synthase